MLTWCLNSVRSVSVRNHSPTFTITTTTTFKLTSRNVRFRTSLFKTDILGNTVHLDVCLPVPACCCHRRILLSLWPTLFTYVHRVTGCPTDSPAPCICMRGAACYGHVARNTWSAWSSSLNSSTMELLLKGRRGSSAFTEYLYNNCHRDRSMGTVKVLSSGSWGGEGATGDS